MPEEAFWIASRAAIERAPLVEAPRADRAVPPSRALPETGYVVARDAAGGHAVFDVGAHGYMNGGHAHADALSLTLSVANRPLLVDPGTSTYTMDPRLRDRMRGSANHNTVTVDGQPQSDPAGPFHWRTSANGRLHASRHNAGFDWAEASHNGYAAIEHRRSVIRADGAGWLVVDEAALRRVREGLNAFGGDALAHRSGLDGEGRTIADGCARRMSTETRRGCCTTGASSRSCTATKRPASGGTRRSTARWFPRGRHASTHDGIVPVFNGHMDWRDG